MTKSLGDNRTIDGVQKQIWSNIVSASSSGKPISRDPEELSPGPATLGSMLGSGEDSHGSLQRPLSEGRTPQKKNESFESLWGKLEEKVYYRNLALERIKKDKTFEYFWGKLDEKPVRQDVSKYVGASLIKQHSYSDSKPNYQLHAPVTPHLPQPQHLFLRPQQSLPESTSNSFWQTPIVIFPWKQIYSNQIQQNFTNASSASENNLTDSQKRALELTGAPLINFNANAYTCTNTQQNNNLSLHMLKINAHPLSNDKNSKVQQINNIGTGCHSINQELRDLNLDMLNLNLKKEHHDKTSTKEQDIGPSCTCCTICYPQYLRKAEQTDMKTKNMQDYSTANASSEDKQTITIKSSYAKGTNKVNKDRAISPRELRDTTTKTSGHDEFEKRIIQIDNLISLSQKPKPPLKRTNGTTYSIQGDMKDCIMSPKSNSHYNNMEEMSYNDTLAGQKWHPIEIESEDEERFLPSDLLVDSNLVQGKAKSRSQPQKNEIARKHESIINDPSKKYNTLLPHLWRVCRTESKRIRRKEKVLKAKSFDFNSTLNALSNNDGEYAAKMKQMSKEKHSTAPDFSTLVGQENLKSSSGGEANTEGNISNSVEESNDSAYSSDDNNIRNLENVIIKKPVKKASSWNIADKSTFSEKETEDCEETDEVNNSELDSTESEEKIEDTKSFEGKFSLFPKSTDSDPMSALRNNWKVTTSYFSDENLYNHDEESEHGRQSLDTVCYESLEVNAVDNHESKEESSKFDNFQNHSTLDKKQSFCLEATLKHLDLEAAILPSI